MIKTFQILFFSGLITLFYLTGFSQIAGENKDIFNKAEKQLELGEYENALTLYLLINDTEPDIANINYRIGQCYSNLLGKERESLKYLENAVENIDEDYKAGKINSHGASPYAWFLLGEAYHREGMLPEASKAYNKYRYYIQNDKKELALVTERIVGLGFTREEIRDHPKDVILINLGKKINTKSSEYSIIFSGDLKTRVFNRFDNRDIVFYSAFENGSWTNSIDITEQIGSLGNMYATALSYDGKELYLIMLIDNDADIYISEFKEGQWTYAENMEKNINSKYIESNACISSNGKVLYFSSDRPSNIGGFDIYLSRKIDGEWSKSENLGEKINSKWNEESPFIIEDGDKLYFSSDRPGSIGRMDVYFSQLENNEWSTPENIGMPYNSVEDDIAFKYYEKYGKSYIARDIPEGYGKLDLYLIQSKADREKELLDLKESIASLKFSSDVVIDEIIESHEELAPSEPQKAPTNNLHFPEFITEDDSIESDQKLIPDLTVETDTNQPEKIEVEYTVQILALAFPEKYHHNSDLDTSLIMIIEGDDGRTRYIYGLYKTREEAEKALEITLSKGYKDAYIRKTSDINNYH